MFMREYSCIVEGQIKLFGAVKIGRCPVPLF